MVMSLGPMQRPRLLQSPAQLLSPGTAAAAGTLEESRISDCNFAAPSPPRWVRQSPTKKDLDA